MYVISWRISGGSALLVINTTRREVLFTTSTSPIPSTPQICFYRISPLRCSLVVVYVRRVAQLQTIDRLRQCLTRAVLLEIFHSIDILANTKDDSSRLWEAKEHLSLAPEEHVIGMKFHSMCFLASTCGEPMAFWCKELVIWGQGPLSTRSAFDRSESDSGHTLHLVENFPAGKFLNHRSTLRSSFSAYPGTGS